LKKNDNRRFLYHAQGSALGGFITAPVTEALETQAAVSLPITGGYGRARSGAFRFRDFVSLRAAHSYVSGQPSLTGGFETLVTSVVEGLNILDVVTADRIVARIAASHSGKPGAPPTITTAGSHFENLRIAGQLVEVEWLDQPDKPEDFKTLTNRFEKNLQSYVLTRGWGEQGFFPVSMLRKLRIGQNECEPGRNSRETPHLGSIHLGELIVSTETQRLTMLRVELGCAVQGSLAACSVEGDGHQTDF
jgi:hypothetical protein